ncbi:MAG: putative small metal-binding protein [Halobacteriales archaeon]|jgi:predicted small metal-binding protein
MKRLECPIEGCTGVVEAETEEELMAQAEDHAASAHPDVELDAELVETIKSNIKEV